ncbi:bacillithiol biosynthesis cysteine-adding enzyme BshC [Fulvivirga sp. M361]|uniref:bacillithiol biosynthesis cysteine-adding enzyme BshC n=1 Tax=Fulvivirga sp. M361 TaxID=2594266 RepID=UPI001179FAAE|nr:bacillithiol biosynthesis cysteine-adding enzyme BshC [Fulvivirga sp. M361]TRX51602.1 bacillithiol biosynthesis cysteine-adding enzyme BshC [Fulvivirga sp. M361]
MAIEKVDLQKTKRFGKLFLDYLEGKAELREFYGGTPEIESFKAQIANKKFAAEKRKILCQTLEEQYDKLPVTDHVKKNLQLLAEENTYTITTGHQLNLFTGPLYFIYKIVTVINTCRELSAAYPDHNFVPVYWMASEDHDFEEINHFRFNEKKYTWNTDQSGAVGHFDLSTFQNFIDAIPGVPDFFKKAYKEQSLADAARNYVNHLFGDYGIIVVDADRRELKQQISDVMTDDLFHHTSKRLVDEQSEKINNLGYKTQVSARSINFFYLAEQLRERIEVKGEKYEVLNSALTLDKKELVSLIQKEPEKLSPNVILRPLYQEKILPNLAYIGGPAEVAYWMQLKTVFDHYEEAFPILMPRNFGLVVPAYVRKKWDKIGFETAELFTEKHQLLAKTATKYADHKIYLNGQVKEVLDLFNSIKEQAQIIDPTLMDHVEAQQAKAKHSLEVIEKKFIRAEKRQQSDKLRQMESVLDHLFPNGSLQERTNNFLDFYLENTAFIAQLITYFDPFDYRFYVMDNGG